MSASSIATQLTDHSPRPYVLRVGPHDLLSKTPLSIDAMTFSESVDDGSPGEMRFTVRDPNTNINISSGMEVTLYDTGNARFMWGGVLVNRRFRRDLSGTGRLIMCQAYTFDAWLDWRLLIKHGSRDNTISRITKTSSDRVMVQRACSTTSINGANFLTARNAEIQETNTNMDNMTVSGLSLRGALERIGQIATVFADTSTRHFYVDHQKRVHYYKGAESLAAPYRIADSAYTTIVLATAGLVELWSLREETGATAYGGVSINATLNGGYTQGGTAGMVNEEAKRATTLNGTTGYATASGASLHPGDTWSVECWFKRGTTGSQQAIWSGGANDILIGFNNGDNIRVQKEGVGDNFVTNASYTDSSWHHLVVTRSPGTTTVYVDGVSKAGTNTARTFVAGAGAVNIGRKLSTTDQFLSGSIQHVAVYSTELTANRVLAHYNQGISLAPEDLEVEYAGAGRRGAVYVQGQGKDGSGWVFDKDTITDFQIQVQDTIQRDDCTTPSKVEHYGRAFFVQYAQDIVSATFSVKGYNGWGRGQLLHVSDSGIGVDADLEIKSVETDANLGNGTFTYRISAGAVKRRVLAGMARRSR